MDKGYTQYSEPEAWLSLVYPAIHAIWRRAISSNTVTTLNMELTCAICKVKSSSGHHYGVKMCEADKQFLKRSFHQQLHYPPCSNGESGVVCPPRPRGWCQICRLQTCLANPVNIAMIRVGGKVKKSKKEIRIKSQDPILYTNPNMTVVPSKKLQSSNVYFSGGAIPSVTDVVSSILYTPPTAATYQYLQYPLPYYNMPSTHQPRSFSTYDFEGEKLLIEPSIDDAPLDLRMNTVQEVDDDDDEWFRHEVAFTELHSQLQRSENLDESIFPFLDSNPSSWNRRDLSDDIVTEFPKSVLSKPLTSCSVSAAPSPVLESSYCVNKLSLNSTVLGQALSQIQASISLSSSLANLSSVSDILADGDGDK